MSTTVYVFIGYRCVGRPGFVAGASRQYTYNIVLCIAHWQKDKCIQVEQPWRSEFPLFPGWYNAPISPQHRPFSLFKCRRYASRRLNVVRHPPTITVPSNTHTVASSPFARTPSTNGTPSASASMSGTPQHTHFCLLCVAMCRRRSGPRRLC